MASKGSEVLGVTWVHGILRYWGIWSPRGPSGLGGSWGPGGPGGPQVPGLGPTFLPFLLKPNETCSVRCRKNVVTNKTYILRKMGKKFQSTKFVI